MSSDSRVPVYDGVSPPLPDDVRASNDDKYMGLPDSPPKLLADDVIPPAILSDDRVPVDDGMTMLSPLRPEDGGDGDGMNQSDSPPRMSREDTAHSLVRRVLGYVLFSK